jgi:hypothetical protein
LRSVDNREGLLQCISEVARLDVCAVVETWFRKEDELGLVASLSLGREEFVWFGRQQRAEEGGEGRGGVGFLVRKGVEAKVVKEGKEGNLLWIVVGKENPWYLAVVYVAPGKTDQF